MTVKECYEMMGGDYDGVVSRLMGEPRVIKFALRFLDDKSFELLETSLENKDYAEAFRAAHTIKGVCQNLGFTTLYKSAFDMTEALRGEVAPNDETLFENVKRDYELTISAIKQLA